MFIGSIAERLVANEEEIVEHEQGTEEKIKQVVEKVVEKEIEEDKRNNPPSQPPDFYDKINKDNDQLKQSLSSINSELE